MSAKELFYSKEHSFSEAEARTYAREDLIYNVTEDLLLQMEDLSVSKVELSRSLNKSRAYVSQLLGGSRNMTLASLSDICFALGIQPKIEFLSTHQECFSEKKTTSYTTDTWQLDEIEIRSLNPIVLDSNIIDRSNPAQWERVA